MATCKKKVVEVIHASTGEPMICNSKVIIKTNIYYFKDADIGFMITEALEDFIE